MGPYYQRFSCIILFFLAGLLYFPDAARAQTAMTNIESRNKKSLDGEWKVIIDPTGSGEWRQLWQERKPKQKTDFVEYSFDDAPTLQVPGDFNTQMPELLYMESVVWYRKVFQYHIEPGKRLFVYFGAVNYMADVYLNGKPLGKHEGGFTPFQFELTGLVSEGENRLIVKADNQRRKDGLPGLGYDWFNYGGITREVYLVETGNTFIEDYCIQLQKGSLNRVAGWVKLNNTGNNEKVAVRIPELKINYTTVTNGSGYAPVNFSSKFRLWSPENPKLYTVRIETEGDTIGEDIGFRSIAAEGTRILLNNKLIFLRGVDIHEERPEKAGRAYSEADALTMLTWAKELGCNFVRLVHYPHSEHMVKLAEKMGLMAWDEIPAYQNIEFTASGMKEKLDTMMREMVRRDRNRCAVVIWSLANETYSSPGRTNTLIELSAKCRREDSTRLITTVLSNQAYSNNAFNVWDTITNYFDVIAVNEYAGWYTPWQGRPSDTKWSFVSAKPLIISEFGGEARYGSNFGPKDEADSWSEEYQAHIYKDQIEMFQVTPNLAGVSPWLLFDYRSPVRMRPLKQDGYNRKGLLSQYGERKKAWYVLKQYYDSISNADKEKLNH
jgi:beta-glucuronidase